MALPLSVCPRLGLHQLFPQEQPWRGAGHDLHSVWGAGAGVLWAVGDDGTVLARTALGWSSLSTKVDTQSTSMSGIGGSRADDVWAVGTAYLATGNHTRLLHWNGSDWRVALTVNPGHLYGIGGSGPNDVWLVGDVIRHWNGNAWSELAGLGCFRAVWASGPDDAWAVGGTAAHWDGASWSIVADQFVSWYLGSTVSLNAVWGSGPADVWAVGSTDAIFHWDGSTWGEWRLANRPDSTCVLTALWGSAADDVWAVGDHGLVLHWAGSGWVAVKTPSTAPLTGVWGSARNDVWAVGFGTVLHWNGSAWRSVVAVNPLNLSGVWGAGPDDVWAVGDVDTSLRLRR